MRYLTEFRDYNLVNGILRGVNKEIKKEVNLMEVCGTHTVAIFKFGIKSILPKKINLVSGPGCPVCVTSTTDIDIAIKLSQKKEVILTTFGDMIKVPGSFSSLEKEKTKGKDVKVIYSSLEALEIAKKNKEKKVIFFSVGFETTSPNIAFTILEAKRQNIKNFFILCSHKLIPPAMKALLNFKDLNIDGFICPGHVSTIIGSLPYEFIAQEHKIPCIIAGFEPLDILQSIYMLLKQINNNEAKVEIQYRRVVKQEGNKKAKEILYEVFEKDNVSWRGIGLIPQSGLKLKKKYANFNALENFSFKIKEKKENKNCLCGNILRGIASPLECKLFKKKCTPLTPFGPCMVSSEGTCSAWYKYNLKN